jgi:NNP family nitrate/nitrite transporter-like MFS transporter
MDKRATRILTMNTLAFTGCFACWVLNGVLVTFLVNRGLFHWDAIQIGWLIGLPILTGSVTRLPIGLLTDHYGGRPVFTTLMLLSAAAIFLGSFATTFGEFILAGLGLGLAGASFAVGVTYTSLWFPPERQGTALGIFGVGNIGAAITSVGAPFLLSTLTKNGAHLEGWRSLPQIYAVALVVLSILFVITTSPKKVEHEKEKTFRQRLTPLKNPRVWRFGLYYFFVFGGFVTLAQWLVPYYLNSYEMPLKTAGLLAAVFSLPCGLIRAFGGWISDKWGARSVLYAVFGVSLGSSLLLVIPHLDIRLFTLLLFLLGIFMGIGMGAVYKHIPSYFPNEVGVVGGLVGVIGGLGGFFLPMLFGILLKTTGLWTSCWVFLVLLAVSCLVWMHRVVRQIEREKGLDLEVAHA